MKSLFLVLFLARSAFAQTTECASVFYSSTPGTIGVDSVSADGRFVLFHRQNNATQWIVNVYLRDRLAGTVELVDVAIGGGAGNDRSYGTSISSDGNLVAFFSSANNLVPNDTNGVMDVFVRDRLHGTTERVNVGPGGVQANATSDGSYPVTAMSPDGRFVAFPSYATNLAGFTDSCEIFLRDRQNATTELISLANDGTDANYICVWPAMSSDARFIAFTSVATNLYPGGLPAVQQHNYVRDRQSGTTQIISLSTSGQLGNDISSVPSMSADGRFVVFASNASNLDPVDTNGVGDAFLRDLQNQTTALVSLSADGKLGNAASGYLAQISADGSRVSFGSDATNLVPGDLNGKTDMFVRNLALGTTELMSVSSAGIQGNGASNLGLISSDGRYVAFQSTASNLVPGDSNGNYDVFVRDSTLHTTTCETVTAHPGDSYSLELAISADGHTVAFRSNASNLVPGHFSGFDDVYAYNVLTGAVDLVSVPNGGGLADGSSYSPSVSSDGRFVAFESDATNVAGGATNNARNIYVRDRVLHLTELISVGNNGQPASGNSYHASISGDGRYVAFRSDSVSLVPGGTSVPNIYVRDRQLSRTTLVSETLSGVPADAYCDYPAISNNGYVAFGSDATNLNGATTNGSFQIYRGTVLGGPPALVSANGVPGNSDSEPPVSITADGNKIAFASDASNLVPNDSNGFTDVFVRTMVPASIQRVSVASDGSEAFMNSANPSISGAGRFVAFDSDASTLVPGDTNGVSDVFVHDLQTGATTIASLAWDGFPGGGTSDMPAISSDGRYIAFHSLAPNLVPFDTNNFDDVFVRDRGVNSVFTTFCFGDGTQAACPCANDGSAGHGCQNSQSTGGALLTAVGNPSLSADTMLLTASNELPTALSIYLQGTGAVSPTIFGDGLRCAGGTLKRLYTKHAIGGACSAPQPGDASFSARSAALGDTIALGATRIYQVYYRDANITFCAGGFDVTPAVAAAWGE